MRILALDASTKSTGYAVFEDNKITDHGCISCSSTDLVGRIHTMTDQIKLLIKLYKIDKVVLEEVRPEDSKIGNLKTHKALMYLQAAIVFLVYDSFDNKIQIDYVYPNEWRRVCGIKTGRGIKRESLKALDIDFVEKEFGIITKNDDIADAICIGYAYLNNNNNNNEMNWE